MKKTLPTCRCILKSLIILFLFSVSTLQAQEIKKVKTVTGVREFSDYAIHPHRYVLTKASENPWPPVIYDIKTGKTIRLHRAYNLPGLPKAPKLPRGKERRYKRSELILKGQYFRWKDSKVVSFDGENVGFLLKKESIIKTVKGNPPCSCGGNSRLVEKFSRYFCDACKEYIKEKEYTRKVVNYFYGNYSVAKGGIQWIAPLKADFSHPMEQHALSPVGYDHRNGYFYYASTIHMYKKRQTTGSIKLYRFNVSQKKTDWQMSISIPIRYKGKTARSYSVSRYISPDLKYIIFWEYDESYNKKRGWLQSPSARGVIVNTDTKTVAKYPAMVTSYGKTVSRDGKYAILGSNQLGRIEMRETLTGKLVKSARSRKSIYYIFQNNKGNKLYVFNKYTIEIFSYPELKRIKSMPIGRVLQGVTKMLVVGHPLTLDKGKTFIFHVMEKTKSGYWASDREKGFEIYRVAGD